jgi:hypothetical protein
MTLEVQHRTANLCDDTWGAAQNCQLLQDTSNHIYKTHTCFEAFVATSVNNILGWQLHQMVQICVTSAASVACHQNSDGKNRIQFWNIAVLTTQHDCQPQTILLTTNTKHSMQHSLTPRALSCTALCCAVLCCIAQYCAALHCAVLHCAILCCAEAESIWQLKIVLLQIRFRRLRRHDLQTIML